MCPKIVWAMVLSSTTNTRRRILLKLIESSAASGVRRSGSATANVLPCPNSLATVSSLRSRTANFLGKGQSQSQPRIISSQPGLQLPERFENGIQLFACNANPGVAHLDGYQNTARFASLPAEALTSTSPFSVNLMAFPIRWHNS